MHCLSWRGEAPQASLMPGLGHIRGYGGILGGPGFKAPLFNMGPDLSFIQSAPVRCSMCARRIKDQLREPLSPGSLEFMCMYIPGNMYLQWSQRYAERTRKTRGNSFRLFLGKFQEAPQWTSPYFSFSKLVHTPLPGTVIHERIEGTLKPMGMEGLRSSSHDGMIWMPE